jgi:hypothetical protein
MPTPPARASDAKPYRRTVWRVVEQQSRPATMPLVDTLAEQDLLEQVIEESKPAIPANCRRLDHLLATPFRYRAPDRMSRFRRGGSFGCFYAAEVSETAAIEWGFGKLLFVIASRNLPPMSSPIEGFAFSARVSGACLDLTAPPLDAARTVWTHPSEYGPCQDFAATALAEGIPLLRYQSVRDPDARGNLAVLDCSGFEGTKPGRERETWWVFIRSHALQLRREFPALGREIPLAHFAADPRIAAWLSSRGA